MLCLYLQQYFFYRYGCFICIHEYHYYHVCSIWLKFSLLMCHISIITCVGGYQLLKFPFSLIFIIVNTVTVHVSRKPTLNKASCILYLLLGKAYFGFIPVYYTCRTILKISMSLSVSLHLSLSLSLSLTLSLSLSLSVSLSPTLSPSLSLSLSLSLPLSLSLSLSS